MASLWKSFVEAMAPPKHGKQVQGGGVTLNCMVHGRPLSHCEPQGSHAKESGSKAPLEHREVRADLNVDLARENRNARVEGIKGDSDVELQESGEAMHPGTLANSIAAPRTVPTTSVTTASASTELKDIHTSQSSESGESLQVLDSDIGMGAVSAADLIEDAKFYQDIEIGYQDAYETLCIQQEELQHQYTQQAQLVEEASEALRAAESKSSLRYQEFIALQQQWEADIQHAVDKAVSQYQLQLSSVKSSLQQKDQKYQYSIQKLLDQVQPLELSLAGQATLSSLGTSCTRSGLHEEVFNILPGTVNTHREAAQYDSQDQTFLFHNR